MAKIKVGDVVINHSINILSLHKRFGIVVNIYNDKKWADVDFFQNTEKLLSGFRFEIIKLEKVGKMNSDFMKKLIGGKGYGLV